MINWLFWGVVLLFAVCMVVGAVKGVFKIALSLVSTVLTLVIVGFLSPYIADAIAEHTPVKEVIEKKIVEQFMPEIPVEELAQADLSGTPLEDLSSDEIANLDQVDWDMLGISARDILQVMSAIPRDEQIRLINKSSMPGFLKVRLQENNNPAIYEELHVKTFPEYIAAYLSRMGIRIVSFLATFIIAVIIVKALFVAVNIIGELPVVGFFNHLSGGVLGIAVALIVVWIIFLGITVCYSTKTGRMLFDMVDHSQFLTFLYRNNPLLSKLLGF